MSVEEVVTLLTFEIADDIVSNSFVNYSSSNGADVAFDLAADVIPRITIQGRIASQFRVRALQWRYVERQK